jgi:O-antigen ligase
MSKNFITKFEMHTFIKALFYLFPFFMLLESAFITFYLTIFTISILFFYYLKKIEIKFDNIDYLIIIFFLLKFITTLFNINILGNFFFFKSILDFRFLIFFIVIRKLIFHELVNLRFLFLVALSCTIFLSLDIIYQNINGKDLFGNLPFDGRFNGTFEHEAIAGGYIQKNFLFALCIIFLLKIKNLNKFFLLTFVTIILGSGILLSFDRMPFIIFLLIIFLLIISLKQYKIFFGLNLFFLFAIFISLFYSYEKLQYRYFSLYNEFDTKKIKNISTISKTEQINSLGVQEDNKKEFTGYFKIYKTAFYIWSENPIIGSGTRSFQKVCLKMQLREKNITCSTHPHNIYFEILSNQGLLGFTLFILFIITLLINFYKKITSDFSKNKNIINKIFLIILISELWPLRSYGSIFQTVNGSMFWFTLALISSYKFSLK